MISVVIDTNVIFSGLLTKKGYSHLLLKNIDHPDLRLNISVPLILEYEKMFFERLSDLTLSKTDITNFLDFICRISAHIKIHYLWRPFLKDQYDDMVLELAINCSAKYIVTYNVKDFLNIEQFGLSIIKPYELLKKLGVIK